MWLAAAMTRLTIAGAFSGAIARVPTSAALPACGDFTFDFAGFRFDRHFFGRFGDFGFEPRSGR